MQMTYRKAIIILDRLVTTERIEVDRDELRAAVKVAQKALNNVAYLPPNHGRLIDADELLQVIEENSYRLRSAINSTENGMFLTGIRQAIDEAPTIIEAEVSEWKR